MNRVAVVLTSVLLCAIPVAASAAQPVQCNGTCYGVFTTASAANDFSQDIENDGKVTANSYAYQFFSDGNQDTFFSFEGPNEARARASLIDGSVRAGVQTTIGAEVNAQWFEQVTFNLPQGASSANIDVLWNVNGFNHPYTLYPTDSLNSQFSVSGLFTIRAFSSGHESVEFNIPTCDYGLCGLGNVGHIFTETMRIDADTLYTIQMRLYVGGVAAISDFSHTAFLNLVLPEGVSLTSSSGVFLSQPLSTTGAVPEPATWAMMIMGFGAAGSMIRRRKAVFA